jgi:hypothetical protein
VTRTAPRANRGTAFRFIRVNAASRRILLAAALQILSSGLRVPEKDGAKDKQMLVPVYLKVER